MLAVGAEQQSLCHVMQATKDGPQRLLSHMGLFFPSNLDNSDRK